MKILLLNPSINEVSKNKKRRGFLPPLNLLIIASLTPDYFKVKIVDENVEDINLEEKADLVGITCMTPAAPRAYYYAQEFKKRGAKVVIGGIHASALPEEALQYADSVCIGEAEAYWDELLKDFLKGNLKNVYQPSPDYFKKEFSTPPLKRELIDQRKYLFPDSLQTTRGCPYNCAFCSVTKFFGNKFRFRKIEEILAEISNFKNKKVVFVDDNIIGNKNRAKKLFQSLIPFRIKWFSQSSIDIADDEELLKLAKLSGCTALFIGFESLVKENLEAVGKKINISRKFEEAIKKLHSYKIYLTGAFIFGFDTDDEGIVKRTIEFAKKMKLEVAQFGILTPFPGTQIFKKLKEENRIFDFNWRNYDIAHVVFKPLNFTPEKLQEKFIWAYRNFYSIFSIIKRLGFFKKYYRYLLLINLAFRKAFRKRENNYAF